MSTVLLNQWFNEAVMKALAWTFVHSLWQGLIAALLVAMIISVTRNASARLRYNLFGAVILIFLTTSFITFCIEWQQEMSIHQATSAISTFDTTIEAVAITPTLSDKLSAWISNNTDLLMPAWALFFLLNCMKLVAGLVSVNRLRHYKTKPASHAWQATLKGLREQLGINRLVQLLESELVKVPVVLGVLKPVILLPVGLLAQVPPEQIEAVLMHELAHIRRKDFLINFLQHFAEAIFFFNPALLWISSLLRQEREACCDDIAVAGSGQKRNYLQALVSFQEYSLNTTPYIMALGTKRQYLLNRVKRIVTNQHKTLDRFEKISLAMGVVLFSVFSFIAKQELPDSKSTAVNKKVDTVILTRTNAFAQAPGSYLISDTAPRKARLISSRTKRLPGEVEWRKAALKTRRPDSSSRTRSFSRIVPPSITADKKQHDPVRLKEKADAKAEALKERASEREEDLKEKQAAKAEALREQEERRAQRNIERAKDEAVIRQRQAILRQTEAVKLQRKLREIRSVKKNDTRIINNKLKRAANLFVKEEPAVSMQPTIDVNTEYKLKDDKNSQWAMTKKFTRVEEQEWEHKISKPSNPKPADAPVAAAVKEDKNVKPKSKLFSPRKFKLFSTRRNEK